jgi:hypothetical protein
MGWFAFEAIGRRFYSFRAVRLAESMLDVEVAPFLRRNDLTDAYMTTLRTAHWEGMPVELFAYEIVALVDGARRGPR